MTSTRDRAYLRPALGIALAACALGLWLAGSETGTAATTSDTQDVSATVTSSISWGNAGSCAQSMPAVGFGSIAAGSTSTSTVYTGCLTSNATWGVTASVTTPPTSGGNTLPASALVAQTATVPTLANTSCDLTNTTCTLNQSRTLVADAPATPLVGTVLTNAFTYQLRLAVPSNQPSGTYTGGVVTFVAQN